MESSDLILNKLKEKRARSKAVPAATPQKKEYFERLRAKKSISFDEFIETLTKLVEKAFVEDGVKMSPDEGAMIKDREQQINHPYIFFKIVSAFPQKNLKPHLVEEKIRKPETKDDMYPVRDNVEEEAIETWRHPFEYTIQFDIFAADYRTANRVLNEFESLMIDYTGYLKENGVRELLYKDRLTDDTMVEFRERYSIRTVRYTLLIDKMNVVTRKIIERLLSSD